MAAFATFAAQRPELSENIGTSSGGGREMVSCEA
jgi:hypothetical protein